MNMLICMLVSEHILIFSLFLSGFPFQDFCEFLLKIWPNISSVLVPETVAWELKHEILFILILTCYLALSKSLSLNELIKIFDTICMTFIMSVCVHQMFNSKLT